MGEAPEEDDAGRRSMTGLVADHGACEATGVFAFVAALTPFNCDSLGNARSGAVGLTLVAAEAHLGNLSRAKAALADFNAAVPSAKTVSAIKKWMHPGADLAGYEPLFEGLRLAGVSD